MPKPKKKATGGYQPGERSLFTQPVSFDKEYPSVDSLLIKCVEHEGGRQHTSTFGKGSFTGHVGCCRGDGGTEIKSIVDDIVSKREGHRATSVSCSGREKTGSGTRRCEQTIDIEVTISYKKRLCPKCGLNEVDDVYRLDHSYEGIEIHNVTVPTCGACGSEHVTQEIIRKADEARSKK